MDINKITISMTNQKPNEDQIKRIEDLRYVFVKLAEHINYNVKDSREKDISITKLEETLMWAVKGIVLEDK